MGLTRKRIFYGLSLVSDSCFRKQEQQIELFKLRNIFIAIGPSLFLLVLLLFPHLATHLALKLMKALNLISSQNAAHLGPNAGVKPDFICLCRRQSFCGSADLCFVKLLAHDRAIKRLSGLP